MRNAETLLGIIRDRGRRKTLVTCHDCHVAIHAGHPARARVAG